MDYRQLGNTGLEVSKVCLGTMMFGGQTNEQDSTRIMHDALDRGINFFDTANMYNVGESEVVVGRAIQNRRDEVILATKGRQKMGDKPNQQGGSRKHLMHALEDSLRRLGTDYVDIYYYHAPDYTVDIDETLRAMDDMVRQGKTHYIACSNFRTWRLMEALWTSDKLNLNRFCCVQPLYNMVNRDIEVELLPMCQEYKVGVVSYSPLARGILTGKYRVDQQFPDGSRAARDDARMRQAELRDASIEISQSVTEYCGRRNVTPSSFAIAWCQANPILTSVIIGPRTFEQYADNISCVDIEITAEDEAFVDGLVPPGEHSGKGFQDSAYPIFGRPT